MEVNPHLVVPLSDSDSSDFSIAISAFPLVVAVFWAVRSQPAARVNGTWHFVSSPQFMYAVIGGALTALILNDVVRPHPR